MTSRGTFLFAALALIWGIPYLLIKVAMGELTPASLVFLRTTLGAALLLPFVLGRGRLRALAARWRPLLLYTVAELAIPWVLLSDVERRVDSSLAGLMVASVPLVGALLSRFTGDRHAGDRHTGDRHAGDRHAGDRHAGGRDRLSGLELGGLGLGFAGVVILLGFNLGAGDLWAIVEMLLVVVGYAVGPMVIARRLSDLPVLDVVAASLVICAVGYAPVGLYQLPDTLPSPAVLGAVLGLGALCTAVAFVAFFKLIAEVGPTRATVVVYLNPAVAVLAGVLLLGEPFSVTTALGFLLILAGAWFAAGRARHRVEPHPEPVLATETPTRN